jgi:hypothetical protein
MPFSVPNAVNYSSPLNAVPLDWIDPPVEGNKGIQCSITWATDAGANGAVYVNCQNNATLNFSKIRAIVVDNSQCGADVTFVFPDTETTVSVPAYTPYAIIPVFTNQTQFYAIANGYEGTDTTRFTILNTSPPPVALPTTQEQNFSGIAGEDVTATTGSVPLVGSQVNGTLEGVFIGGTLGSTATGLECVVTLKDGTGKILAVGSIGVTGGPSGSGVVNNVVMFQQSDMRVRFKNGINLTWVTGAGASTATVSANLYYREP